MLRDKRIYVDCLCLGQGRSKLEGLYGGERGNGEIAFYQTHFCTLMQSFCETFYLHCVFWCLLFIDISGHLTLDTSVL